MSEPSAAAAAAPFWTGSSGASSGITSSSPSSMSNEHSFSFTSGSIGQPPSLSSLMVEQLLQQRNRSSTQQDQSYYLQSRISSSLSRYHGDPLISAFLPSLPELEQAHQSLLSPQRPERELSLTSHRSVSSGTTTTPSISTNSHEQARDSSTTTTNANNTVPPPQAVTVPQRTGSSSVSTTSNRAEISSSTATASTTTATPTLRRSKRLAEKQPSTSSKRRFPEVSRATTTTRAAASRRRRTAQASSARSSNSREPSKRKHSETNSMHLKKPPPNAKNDSDYDETADQHEHKSKKTKLSTSQKSSTKVGEDDPNNCCICLCEPDKEQLAMIEGCVHLFCFDCISQWADRENTCPLCKNRFTRIKRLHPPKRVKGQEKQKPQIKHVKDRNQRADSNMAASAGAALEGLLASIAFTNNGNFLFQERLQRYIRERSSRDGRPVPAALEASMQRQTAMMHQWQQERHQRFLDRQRQQRMAAYGLSEATFPASGSSTAAVAPATTSIFPSLMNVWMSTSSTGTEVPTIAAAASSLPTSSHPAFGFAVSALEPTPFPTASAAAQPRSLNNALPAWYPTTAAATASTTHAQSPQSTFFVPPAARTSTPHQTTALSSRTTAAAAATRSPSVMTSASSSTSASRPMAAADTNTSTTTTSADGSVLSSLAHWTGLQQPSFTWDLRSHSRRMHQPSGLGNADHPLEIQDSDDDDDEVQVWQHTRHI